ncbi:MAG: hypothetical protein SOX32_12105 [Candidatus Choladocola sp.]|nr:hypothetical protein [Candidatus Choladocola sp.]
MMCKTGIGRSAGSEANGEGVVLFGSAGKMNLAEDRPIIKITGSLRTQ